MFLSLGLASLETYLGGAGDLGARVFRPLISIKTNDSDEFFSMPVDGLGWAAF